MQVSFSPNHYTKNKDLNDRPVIFAWGNSKKGSLGIGDTEKTDKPMLLPTFIGSSSDNIIKDIYTDNETTIFLNEEGDLYICGSYLNSNHPVKINLNLKLNIVMAQLTEEYIIVLEQNGKIYVAKLEKLNQSRKKDEKETINLVELKLSEKVMRLASGGNYSLMLTQKNTLLYYGAPSKLTQLLKNTDEVVSMENNSFVALSYEKIVDFDCSKNSCAFVDRDSIVRTLGNLSSTKTSKTGIESFKNIMVITKIKCTDDFFVALNHLGDLFVYTPKHKIFKLTVSNPTFALSAVSVMSVAVSRNHIMALSDNGDLISFGLGSEVMGHGSSFSFKSPQFLSSLESYVISKIYTSDFASFAITQNTNNQKRILLYQLFIYQRIHCRELFCFTKLYCKKVAKLDNSKIEKLAIKLKNYQDYIMISLDKCNIFNFILNCS